MRRRVWQVGSEDLFALRGLNLLNKWDKHRELPLLIRAFTAQWDAGTPDQPVRGIGYWTADSLGATVAHVPLKDETDLYLYHFRVPEDMGDNAKFIGPDSSTHTRRVGGRRDGFIPLPPSRG